MADPGDMVYDSGKIRKKSHTRGYTQNGFKGGHYVVRVRSFKHDTLQSWRGKRHVVVELHSSVTNNTLVPGHKWPSRGTAIALDKDEAMHLVAALLAAMNEEAT
jgi:hypothetical protein